MRKRLVALGVASLTAIVPPAWAQTAPAPHKPGAEIQSEGAYYVGNWEFTGDMAATPADKNKFRSGERLEWMPGGYFLMARSYVGDAWSGTTVIGYDAARKVLTHTSYSADGNVEVMTGTVQGDTEIWTGDGETGGKPAKQRMTIRRLSPTQYTFRFETAPENGGWSLLYQGQAFKTS